MRAAHRAVRAAALRRPLDLAAIKAAMEARDRLQFEIRQSNTQRAIAFLERLAPADRAVVAGSVAGAIDRTLSSGSSAPRD
jgi:Spy/CpxP family protein refolding chaperone